MKIITQRDLQNLYEPLPQHLIDKVNYVLVSLSDGEERIIVNKEDICEFCADLSSEYRKYDCDGRE